MDGGPLPDTAQPHRPPGDPERVPCDLESFDLAESVRFEFECGVGHGQMDPPRTATRTAANPYTKPASPVFPHTLLPVLSPLPCGRSLRQGHDEIPNRPCPGEDCRSRKYLHHGCQITGPISTGLICIYWVPSEIAVFPLRSGGSWLMSVHCAHCRKRDWYCDVTHWYSHTRLRVGGLGMARHVVYVH